MHFNKRLQIITILLLFAFLSYGIIITTHYHKIVKVSSDSFTDNPDISLNVPHSTSNIKLYYRTAMDCYFFLPSYASLDEYSIHFDDSRYQISIGNIPIYNNCFLQKLDINTPYTLKVSDITDRNINAISYTVTFMQSQNIPAVFISTSTGTIDNLNSSKDYKEPGEFVCINADGKIDSYGFLDNIKGHGNSSYDEVNKKSFLITFNAATDVLSMGAAKKYILQANAFDDTYLRNKIAYEYCRDLGISYTVDTEYIDLYFNGEYAGNYLLCEKVELGANRVDITDGYLIEKILHDRIEETDQSFQVAGMQDFLIKNPNRISDAELQSIEEYMNTIENLIKSCDSYQKYSNLQEYIDIESFIDMYLINAITNDIDSNIASTYYYITKDDSGLKLHAGPVWDYDNAWGRAERGYVATLNAYPTGYCEELFAIEYFRNSVIEKYNSLAYPLMGKYLSDYIPEYIERISPSISMDAARWLDEGYHSPHYTDYETSVSYLNSYIYARMEHLYDRLNYPERYYYILFTNTSRSAYRDTEYWIKKGESIPDEVVEEIKIHFQCKAFNYGNGKSFDFQNPITNDIIIYGK